MIKLTNDEGFDLQGRMYDEAQTNETVRRYRDAVRAEYGTWGDSFNIFLERGDPFITAYVTAAKLSGEI